MRAGDAALPTKAGNDMDAACVKLHLPPLNVGFGKTRSELRHEAFSSCQAQRAMRIATDSMHVAICSRCKSDAVPPTKAGNDVDAAHVKFHLPPTLDWRKMPKAA